MGANPGGFMGVAMIHYLNTDLVILSESVPTILVDSLATCGVHSLHVTQDTDGLWRGIFETAHQHEMPEANIADMLTAIETLGTLASEVWSSCQLREFDMGYECGSEPWAFNNALSNQLLRRIAAMNACLRITIYPAKPENGVK